MLFHPAARRAWVGRTLRMWEFNNSHQRCARQWKEEWDLCQRCQLGKVDHWCLLSKWQLPVGVPHQRLPGSSRKVVNFFGDRGDQELALYPLHPPNYTALWPAGGKCTVQRQALLAWEESCRSWELSGKHWQLVLFRFGNQLMHGLFSCAVRVAGLCMLFCGGVISVCFSYIGLLCYCLRFACSFITFLVLGSRL